MYKLKSVSNMVAVANLSVEKANNIIANIAYLGKNMHTYFLYQIVKRNLNELLIFLNNTQNTLESIDILECNRLLFNVLDTFYSYINFFECNYNIQFKLIKKDLYDNYFEYAFLYKLRNYAIHQDLPIFKLSREVGENYIKSKFIISKEKLFCSTRISAEIKKRIENQFPNIDDIDIFPIVALLKQILVEVQIKMMNALSEDLLSSFKYLKESMLNNEETYLIKDGTIVNGLLNVLNKYYKAMADNFIYEENLLSNAIINKIYFDFSYIYYGEKM